MVILKNMNTKQYYYFVVITEYGTLSEAAEKLHISEAALSKFIKKLESFIGTPLFVRTRNGLELTKSGFIFYQAARRILESRNQMLYALQQLQSKEKGTIRIASTPYRGAELYSHVYSRFSTLFPMVTLSVQEIYSIHQEEQIHNGGTDFAFGVETHSEYQDVFNLAASRTEIVLAVPSFHPMARRAARDPDHLSSISLAEFKDTPFVLCDRHNNIRLKADQEFKKAGFTPLVSFESSNSLTVESMIRRGVGVGFFSKRYVHQEEEIVFFRLSPPCYETFYIRFPKSRELSEIDKCLIAVIADERLKIRGSEEIKSTKLESCKEALNQQKGYRT